MSPVFIHGLGAISPAGWGLASLRDALAKGQPLPAKDLARPGWTQPLRVRPVPPPSPPPAVFAHARMRRTSAISRFAVAAAFESLGSDAARVSRGELRLGIVVATMTGCVHYSRRFYDEALRDPATASPLLFPETVFNAPASHLAAVLGATAINYTLVGDPGAFLQALALAADWLAAGTVDACLVVGAEELDWANADALRLFTRAAVMSEGAGALYLRRQRCAATSVELRAITDPELFHDRRSWELAARRVRQQLPRGSPHELLCDGFQGVPRLDAADLAAWSDWPGARLSPKRVLGEGLAAAAAWQCVAALDALRQGRHSAANVSVPGCNEQVIGARFESREEGR
jgi:3-oxoacyl-(acyl-carrier-protein) synthase